ncbi:hypothetical protein DSO06_06055 [Candidatus Nezhaarchaeota archaeon WYZ-LMO8]|nr:MAG: hypothetical protein DSO06_06055 [Candidatus Nezhaarchaeota archaeon WYZ-LMO8]TDA35321.1 MAG: hypothetical protein DSO05_05445 [Candidatus Nezhaarchaeota archaeon WYZ-LMO7]
MNDDLQCPQNLGLIVTIDEETCTRCGKCVKVCLTGALQL